MKIHVEIELQPAEIPLATELLSLLKELSLNSSKPNLKNSRELFKTLIGRLDDVNINKETINEINQLLKETLPDSMEDFVSAFMQVCVWSSCISLFSGRISEL